MTNEQSNSPFPLPYEIHITVEESTRSDFAKACKSLQVKPIFLALQSTSSAAVLSDVMTSSIHAGDDITVLAEVTRIVDGLTNAGFKVIRQKIETVPWHPVAPSRDSKVTTTPPGVYFECHLNVLIKSRTLQGCANLQHQLKNIAVKHKAHLSRNAFKVYSPTEFTVMVTQRNHHCDRETFEQDLDALFLDLRERCFKIEKLITEFVIYDSKTSHDDRWLTLK